MTDHDLAVSHVRAVDLRASAAINDAISAASVNLAVLHSTIDDAVNTVDDAVSAAVDDAVRGLP